MWVNNMIWENLFSGAFGGLIGVTIGAILTYKLNLKSQKYLYIKKIKIEKLNLITITLHEYLRSIGKLQTVTVQFIRKEIEYETYKKLNEECQEEMISNQRVISENSIFLEFIYNDIDKLRKDIFQICDLIYDKYYNPNSERKVYNPDDYDYAYIEGKFLIVYDEADRLIKLLQEHMRKELEL